MQNGEFDYLMILEILSVAANMAAVMTGLVLSLTVFVKSIIASFHGMRVDSEAFPSHERLFSLMKSCGRYGFVFLLLGWLLFSSEKNGIFSVDELAFALAVAWAVTGMINLVLGIVSRLLNGRKTGNTLLRKKVPWMMLYSVIYFIASFLLG